MEIFHSNPQILNDLVKYYKSKGVQIRNDWNKIKDYIMLKALRFKFKQNAHLREILLNTGNALLIEHTSRDSYWGDGGNGTGHNKLGLLLMQVRNELTKKDKDKDKNHNKNIMDKLQTNNSSKPRKRSLQQTEDKDTSLDPPQKKRKLSVIKQDDDLIILNNNSHNKNKKKKEQDPIYAIDEFIIAHVTQMILDYAQRYYHQMQD